VAKSPGHGSAPGVCHYSTDSGESPCVHPMEMRTEREMFWDLPITTPQRKDEGSAPWMLCTWSTAAERSSQGLTSWNLLCSPVLER